MRVLVTGGTGFVGSNLVRELIRLGNEVFVTGINSEQVLPENVKNLGHDFASIDWNSLGQIDVLFHQAAINDTTLQDKDLMFKVNVEGSKKLFRTAVNHGCNRIVYASSTAAYGNGPAPYKEDQPLQPLNPYAESKKAVDEFAMQLAAEFPQSVIVGLRYCNVYGPGEGHKEKRASMIYQLAQQMLKENPKIFKFGQQKRDFIYVKDVVTANLMAAEAKQSCIVNCGSGDATSFNEIIKILNDVLGTSRQPDYIDNPWGAAYQDHTQCDMNLAKEKIGFIPGFDIVKGIRDYFESGFLAKDDHRRVVTRKI